MTRRLLAIFDDCGPGDAVAAAFALDALRAANPRAEIVVMAGEHAYEVFRGTKVADRVVRSGLYVSKPRGAVRARLEKVRDAVRLVKELGFGYDLAVTFFWGTLALNLIAFLVARRRVGYVNRLRFLQSVELGAYRPLDDGVGQNQALLAACGASPLPASLAPIARSRADEEAVRATLARHRIDRGKPFAVFHAGSDWACQKWSPASWAALADAVIERHGVQVVWTGSGGESSYVEDVRKRTRNATVSLCGETATLGELSELCAAAAICVSVDSVPWELAAAAGTPAVVLSGPTSPSRRLVAAGSISVVNRTRADIRRMIVRCQASFPHGVCHDYSCPLSQLRAIKVENVLQRIAETGALATPAMEATSR